MGAKSPVSRVWPFIGAVIIMGAAVWMLALAGPYLVFDSTHAAYDWNSEYRDGRRTAWGPRPRIWLHLGDPGRSTYFGNEWYFRAYKDFCREWLEVHGLAEPERQVGGW